MVVGGGGCGRVHRKEDSNEEKSSHRKAERANFFETCFKESNEYNTLTGHHLPKRLGNLYPIMIILLAR